MAIRDLLALAGTWALAALAQPAIGQEDSPTVVAPPKAPIPSGESRFIFSDWAGPELPVWAFLPEGVDQTSAPILIVMHGVNRDADRYLRQWRDVASSCGFMVFAPEFSREAFPTSREYNLGHLSELGESQLRPSESWSFAAIDPLFEEVVHRLGGSQGGFTLYGHSAGSQFVHRFMMIQQGSRATRFIAANAGWYTLPVFSLDYPFGLKGTGRGTADLEAALSRDLVVLLGEEDTNSADPNLNRSEGAQAQGEHRYARGLNFHRTGLETARSHGWKFGWQLVSVPGVAHDNGGMARAAGKLVGGVTSCRAATQ